MWERHYRLFLFIGVYQHLFWHEYSLDTEQSDLDLSFNHQGFLDYISNQTDAPLPINTKKLDKDLASIIKDIEEYNTVLSNYLREWAKTYTLTKAILYTFLCELKVVKSKTPEEIDNLVGKYIRLTQEMVGGQSTALVHAVTSKIVEEEKEKGLDKT